MSGPTIAGQCDKCGGWVTQCNCAALPDVRSEPLLAALRTHIDRRLLDLKDKAAEFKHDNEMTYAINGAMFELMDLLQWLKEYTANMEADRT